MKNNLSSEIRCMGNKCHRRDCIQINTLSIVPFDNTDVELSKLLSFFLHEAPDIESRLSPKLERHSHNDLFSNMIKDSGYNAGHFCASNATIEKELAKVYLQGTSICLKCKRYVCKRRETKKGRSPETDLDCFLRHIRNAIAHGNVFAYKTKQCTYILFEDYNNKNNKSARIICVKNDLKKWRRLLKIATESTMIP